MMTPCNFVIMRFLDKLKTPKRTRPSQTVRVADTDLSEYLNFLSSPIKVFFLNFLAGIGRGLGFVMGATVVVAIILYVIGKVLVEVPLVGHFFEWLNKFLQESLQGSNINGNRYQ